MKKESRIIISGLSEEAAIKMLPQLRREPLSRGAKFELDHPDPPDLLEQEYGKVNSSLADLEGWIQESAEWGSSSTKKEVARDITRLRSSRKELEQLAAWFGETIDALEAGLKKLK